MASPNQIARRAALALMAAESGGFNARLAPLLAENDIKPFTVSFSKGSKNFFQGFIDVDEEGGLDYSQISPDPCAICLYTSGAVDGKITAHPIFSGFVEVRIDVYVRMRARFGTSDGVESDDTEAPMDCIEEALLRCFHEPDEWGSGIVYNRDWKSDRTAILPADDGYMQRVTITLAVRITL